MKIGGRNFLQIVRAVVRREHYIALANMLRRYPNFFENVLRYLTGLGKYPYDIKIRTPIGIVSPRLYSYHDLLTVNEIFCREDYYASNKLSAVLDLGSNIGISALYFLSRNKVSRCFLYEPDPRNIEKLKQNLSGFEDRFDLFVCAVGDVAGDLQFGFEDTGRYGGIGLKHEQSSIVKCVHINEAISRALETVSFLDILKIDTEGMEIKSVRAIADSLLLKIGIIYLEASPGFDLHPSVFTNRQYGSIRQLFRSSGKSRSRETWEQH